MWSFSWNVGQINIEVSIQNGTTVIVRLAPEDSSMTSPFDSVKLPIITVGPVISVIAVSLIELFITQTPA